MSCRLTLHRRHLTLRQRKALVADELQRDPEQSNRQIAATARVDDKTVAAARAKLEHGAEIPHHETRTGKDGVKQPATKPVTTTTPQVALKRSTSIQVVCEHVVGAHVADAEEVQAIVDQIRTNASNADLLRVAHVCLNEIDTRVAGTRFKRKPFDAIVAELHKLGK